MDQRGAPIGLGCLIDLLHAIAMGHQHSASYSDRYIIVNYQNILTDMAYNFGQVSSNGGYEFVYDDYG